MLSLDLDNLVQSIMADLAPSRMGAEPRQDATGLETKIGNTEKEERQNISGQDEIYIDTRVVSLANLNSLPVGVRKLVISPKSVLTPSAKDEVRKRKIELAVRLPLAANRSGGTSLWIAKHAPVALSRTFWKQVQEQWGIEPETFDCLDRLIETTADRLADQDVFGIALTRHAVSLLAKAGRIGSVRAVPAFQVDQAIEDVREINANFLIVHPDRITEAKIMNLILRTCK